MKKLLILLSTFVLATAIPLAAQTTAEANASKIIGMTNAVVDLYNEYIPHLKKASEGLDRAVENIDILAENIHRSAHGWNCANIIVRSDYKETFEKAVKAAPAFPEKTKIQAGIKYIAANNDRLSNHCKALNEYFTKKGYMEDADFEKFQPLYDSLDAAYDDMARAWKTTIDLASEAGDRSELILLKKSPIAQFIIPMKTDLMAASKILEMFREDEIDNTAIQNAITTLKKDIDKNKVLTGKNVANLEKYSSKPNYIGYYESMEEFAEYATKLEELLNLSYQTDNEQRRQDNISTTYSMLQYKYNSLVENYNIM